MGFGPLRVISNEDRVAPGKGWDAWSPRHGDHPRTCSKASSRTQGDSIGTGSTIVPGDVQRMSAGRGVMHSEFNPSRDRPVHFLQIWIEPDVQGVPPSYEQKHFDAAAKRGRLRLIASPDGGEGSVAIHRDARLYAGLFDGAETAEHAIAPGRAAYVHVARGAATINGQALSAGDALRAVGEPAVTISGGRDAEILLFDLAEGNIP
jgi:redox-sensitive bicupin YhaK (pirin superfamily)